MDDQVVLSVNGKVVYDSGVKDGAAESEPFLMVNDLGSFREWSRMVLLAQDEDSCTDLLVISLGGPCKTFDDLDAAHSNHSAEILAAASISTDQRRPRQLIIDCTKEEYPQPERTIMVQFEEPIVSRSIVVHRADRQKFKASLSVKLS